ncbi:PilZ domain-containing protein [Acinetobacter populi]|uniref:Pilus assembly protein n=1 Tax=Acinetobacter populi TaxID=1582270 RepID=A0A1Z9YXJ6_9GAMM|nr:PilZ domain-containing protein [Acinetobacter populi]OUY06928.1 pilus assembly protein [Acinetobacter populi]
MLPARGGAIIQANMPDKESLQACYMPFVSGGGLFVPSQQSVKFGQELLVIASLPEQSSKFPVTGKVIWISPKQNNLKPQGFAIQLSGEKGFAFRNEVERLLAGSLNSEKPTFTM